MAKKSSLAVDINQHPIPAFKMSTVQNIATSGSSAATSAAVGKDIVRIVSTEDVYIEFAVSPTATTSSLLLMKGSTEYFQIDPTFKVAAIEVTAASAVTSVTTCL